MTSRYCLSVDCTLTLTEHANTRVNCPAAGQQCQVIIASTSQDCQAACIGESRCTGYDWNPSLTQGTRCILTGPWSSTRMQGTAQGYTHNDLARKCPGNITHSQHLKSDLPTDPHLNLKPALPAQSLKTHLKWQIAKLNTKLVTKNHVQELFCHKS